MDTLHNQDDSLNAEPDKPARKGLSEAHVRELAESGITEADALAAAWYTEPDPAEVVRLLNWNKSAVRHVDVRCPYLLIPYLDLEGGPTNYHRLKATRPREDDKGKAVKYEAPKKSTNRLFISPGLKAKLSDTSACLLITEGETKALCASSRGLICLGLAGVWAWTKDDQLIPDMSLIEWEDRTVYVAFDSDAATNDHVMTAELALARELTKLGADVRIVRIPPGTSGADGKPTKVGLDDYIVAGGNVENLLNDSKPAKDADTRPKVFITPNLHRSVDAIRRHLARVPNLYRRGNVLVQADEDGKLHPVPGDAMPVTVSRRVRTMVKKVLNDGTIESRQVSPPANVCKGVHATPGDPIREVVSVVSYPQMLPSGRILCDAGYDPEFRLLVTASAGVRILPLNRVTREEARQAVERLLDVFREFPFAKDEGRSKSAVLALILTLLARPMIDGQTPFFLVLKNAPGAGGTLILKAVWRIVTGGDLPTVSYTHDEPESRKVLTSLVLDGRASSVWDNIDGEFGTASFCRFITMPIWEDRVLSISKMMSALNLMVMAGAANNAVLVREMPRRVVVIDLHTDDERPEQTKKERPDLLGYIDEHREELLGAAFTILQH